jgi:hypothetical protein
MNYESSVALGTIGVFYTGGFVNTTPIIYHLLFVYPFILNPINLLLIFILIPSVLINLFKTKEKLLGIALVFFIAIFFSQAFFYVKWIRYFIPTIPFLVIILVFGIKIFTDFFDKKHQKLVFNTIFIILTVTAFLFSFSYFKTVLLSTDSRIRADEFARENIQNSSKIITEIYDLGIVPFNKDFSHITLFDFYALDDKNTSDLKKDELNELIANSDYLIIPSQRIMRNRIINKNEFPNGYRFYKDLDEQFELVYKTPCDIFCRILYIGNPVYALEETANVFDRPTVFIYKIKNESN